ncbi:ATP-binding SpoIIE family protein phosphatase [Streptomyces sp. NPDC054884]|uniref:ATP-binding SpoIIE family protein phosphatase n=1 Tax=Streptomyces sp. ME08-AFT2 TaxID=3028683 RepID=UPI0029B4A243|nr:SpoIIE family protein phosphatase [Streptomyces sp. ME08-AFT2]MDX3311820.1 SpoIIE family protein phosphatase [Streptomyces sp. ME08-AFT2]
MDDQADRLVSRVARELGARADELVADVEKALRRELPALWETPEIAGTVSQNIAEYIGTGLSGLARSADPQLIEPPPAALERARRLARHGIALDTMLRAFRLAQGVVLDRLIAELPRYTADAPLVSRATRYVIATSTRYVDRTSQQDVVAFQEERDRRRQWRLAMVNEAGLRIGTTLDVARTTQELADLAAERFADLVTVDLLDSALNADDTPGPDRLAVRRIARAPAAARDARPPTVAGWPLDTCVDGSPAAHALATGRPSLHHGERSADGHRVHSTMVVPLRARGSTLGVAEFCRHRNPDLYDDEDLLLAQEIAARAAIAVDNARRYTHARATALTLQRSLLPRAAPRQSAVEVAYRYLPAGGQAGVGGDWYDVIPLSGARVALVVGDVVGHGVHAAAAMGRLRTAVRTLADIDLPPDELLTHLDDVVLRPSGEASDDPDGHPGGDGDGDPEGDAGGEPGETGATCLYAVYDPVSRRCTLARAGHVPPAVTSRDGTVELLELPPGPPLGLGGLPFEATEVELPEGTLIALFTDGLIEARDHDVDAGLTRLRHALARPETSLEAICDTVLEAMLPDRPDDDVALLLARTHALGARQVATWDLDADPAAVARARSHVSRQLADWRLEDLAFTAELVVSELVTNAIRYGRHPIRLRLIHDRGLLCEVSDGTNTTPHLRRARVLDEGGRGLLLVAQLAERWGTRHARRGKTVWAELSESAQVPSSALSV